MNLRSRYYLGLKLRKKRRRYVRRHYSSEPGGNARQRRRFRRRHVKLLREIEQKKLAFRRAWGQEGLDSNA
jgi:hypothetical protein